MFLFLKKNKDLIRTRVFSKTWIGELRKRFVGCKEQPGLDQHSFPRLGIVRFLLLKISKKGTLQEWQKCMLSLKLSA